MREPYRNIAFWVRRQATLAPDRIAVEFSGAEIDYATLDRRGAACGGALAALGVAPGDRVGVLMGNRPEHIEAFLGCARLGAIIVPLSTHLAPAELEFVARDAGIRTLVYDGAMTETVKAFVPATEIQHLLAVGEGDGLSYDAALGAADECALEAVSADDVLAIFYTSGTTGRPKGAMLTHDNFFWTNLNMVLALDLVRDERSLVVLPLFHVGGWNVNTLAVWWKGGRVVLEPSFDPERVLKLIDSGSVTSIMGVPTIFQRLAEEPAFDQVDLSALRWCVCGGAPLPVSLIERYHRRGVPFTQGYGLTEAAPNCLFLAPERSIDKAGAAGRPYFFADVDVFDADDAPVGAGGSGEIVVSGPSVMKGYWRRPDDTAAALRGGWLRTGDVGRVDDDDYVYVVDRVKDMYVTGGENVYPAELETALSSHDDVVEAAVIGVPDERWGEAGRAVVVLRPGAPAGEDDLRTFLLERVAKFKVPRDFVFAGSLPRNATGKLLKAELRELYGSES